MSEQQSQEKQQSSQQPSQSSQPKEPQELQEQKSSQEPQKSQEKPSQDQPQEDQQSSEQPQLSLQEILNRPAEEFGNDPNIENAWMCSAIRHMEAYYKLISSIDSSKALIKLTPNDDFIYDEFRKQFPQLNIENLTEDLLKSDEAKTKWREFCMQMKDKIEDFNFATMIRLNSHQDYNEQNSIVVPRAQFLAIEIARNREGLNTDLPPITED